MSNDKQQAGPPQVIAITCWLLAGAGLFGIIYTFTGAFAPFGLLYPAAHTLIIVGIFASFAGIWSMEKWGLYLFMVMLSLKFILDIYTGAFSFYELILLIPAIIFLSYFRKMK